MPRNDFLASKTVTAITVNYATMTTIFWAICCLGFFGFLRSVEFTITSGSSYNNDLHLSVDDIHVDRTKPSKYMLVNIKTSKTDRIRKGFNLLRAVSFTLGSTICAVRAVLDYFHRQRNRAGPVSIHQDGRGFTRPHPIKAAASNRYLCRIGR